MDQIKHIETGLEGCWCPKCVDFYTHNIQQLAIYDRLEVIGGLFTTSILYKCKAANHLFQKSSLRKQKHQTQYRIHEYGCDTCKNIEKEILKNAKVKLYKSQGHIPNFLYAMKTRKRPITDEVVGARTSIACHLLNQTYYNQAAIAWNPQKNTFAKGGDPKWLTRDYRGDWKV